MVGRRQPLPPPDGADRLQPAQDRRVPVRAGRCCWPASRSRCGSSPTPTTTATTALGWWLVMVAIALVALAASVYLVYVLEILKFRGCGRTELRSDDPDTSEHEIEERVVHDIETGEFDAGGIVRARWRRQTSRSWTAFITAGRLDDPRAGGPGVDAGPEPEPRRGDACRPAARRPSTTTRGPRSSTTSSPARGGCASARRRREVRAGDCVVIPPGTAAQAVEPGTGAAGAAVLLRARLLATTTP